MKTFKSIQFLILITLVNNANADKVIKSTATAGGAKDLINQTKIPEEISVSIDKKKKPVENCVDQRQKSWLKMDGGSGECMSPELKKEEENNAAKFKK